MDELKFEILKKREELKGLEIQYAELKKKQQAQCKHVWKMIRDTSMYPEHEWYCTECNLLTFRR